MKATLFLILVCVMVTTVNCKTKKTDRHSKYTKEANTEEGQYESYDGHWKYSKEANTEGKQYKCAVCSKTFKSQQALEQHKNAKHHWESDTKSLFVCPSCQKKFQTEQSLHQHQRAKDHWGKTSEMTEENRDVYVCPICFKSYKSQQALYQHQRDKNHWENNKFLVCPICSRKFESHQALYQHQKDKDHWEIVSKQSIAKQSDSQKDAFVPNERGSGQVFTCPICSKIFKSQNALHQHQRDTGHTNSDPRKTRRKSVEEGYDNIRVDNEDRKKSVKTVKKIVEDIIEQVRKLDGGKIYSPSILKAGSYAANTKIGKADEFDTNIPLNVEIEDLVTSGIIGYVYFDKIDGRKDGASSRNMNVKRHLTVDDVRNIPEGQAKVRVRRGSMPEHLLYKGDLIPHKIQQDLYSKIQLAMKNLKMTDVHLHRLVHGPALTLTIKQPGEHDISIDLTVSIPCDLKVSRDGWPRPETEISFTHEQIDAAMGAGMHLVPKGDETWSISYSKAETKLLEIIDKGHLCRRRVMKMVKKNVHDCESRSNDGLPGVSSYMVKNQLFWSVEQHSGSDFWNEIHFDERLIDTLEDLVESLHKGYMPHFFREKENILAQKDEGVLNRLALCLEKEVLRLRDK